MNQIRNSSCELTCIQQESDFIYKLCDTCDCYSILDKHRKLIIEENSLEEIKVYPNPFSDIINVDFKTNKTDGLIKLFGISGRKILEKKINQDKSININLSKLPS
ncbi:MAG: T9SS type A sorting domain-containing protein [Flavobacteriales bacterium]